MEAFRRIDCQNESRKGKAGTLLARQKAVGRIDCKEDGNAFIESSPATVDWQKKKPRDDCKNNCYAAIFAPPQTTHARDA
jgi:hypothetical protein